MTKEEVQIALIELEISLIEREKEELQCSIELLDAQIASKRMDIQNIERKEH